ncbi:hypothetical protein BgiMline_032018, partial [Biomphalaria glabrata]
IHLFLYLLPHSEPEFNIILQYGTSGPTPLSFGVDVKIIKVGYVNSSPPGNTLVTYPILRSIVKNSNLQVDILVSKDGYHIYIDGSYFCSSQHALPLEKATLLYVRGNIQIIKASF